MTFTTNRFDSHFRKFSSGFMHKQQIFNHQVEFCRMDAVLVIMEVMAEQGAYLLHARLGRVSVPLPHACIESWRMTPTAGVIMPRTSSPG